MKSPFLVLAVTIAVALGLFAYWRAMSRSAIRAPTPAVAPVHHGAAPSPEPKPSDPHPAIPDTATARTDRAARTADGPTGDDEAAQMIRASIRAERDKIVLSPEEEDVLIAAMLEYQEIAAELVKTKIRETSFNGRVLELSVPAFPREGDALRDRFYSAIRGEFPPARADQIERHLGSYFELRFRGFGSAEQKITVTPDLYNPGEFSIVWEAKVSEDAHSLQANNERPWVGASGTDHYTLDQIDSGPLRYLSEAIRSRFSYLEG